MGLCCDQVGKYEKELGDLNVFIAKKNELESELDETKTELLRERKKHDQVRPLSQFFLFS